MSSYSISNVRSTKTKGGSLESYHFGEEIFLKHDPLNLVSKHCNAQVHLGDRASKKIEEKENK